MTNQQQYRLKPSNSQSIARQASPEPPTSRAHSSRRSKTEFVIENVRTSVELALKFIEEQESPSPSP
jgi:hypothetical protein